MNEIYLDYAATTPLDARVREAMEPYLAEEYGNPSSLHERGRNAKIAVDGARIKIASVLNCKPSEIVFTGGGTEAINLAVFGIARKAGKGHIVTTAIEHHAVLRSVESLQREGFEATFVRPNRDGVVTKELIHASLRPDTVLVAVMHANNEIGTIQPVEVIAKTVQSYRQEKLKAENSRPKISGKIPFFLADACQSAGYAELNTAVLGVDLLAFNGSKIYGPKGVGALFVRRDVEISPILYGGGQERGLRSGTENVAGIVGLAKALEIADMIRETESNRILELRDFFIREILNVLPGTELNGDKKLRLPNNVNVSIPGLEGEAAVLFLDEKGIRISTGSACLSTSLEPSHVILALGKSNSHATSSLRFTLGRGTTKQDIECVLKVLPEVAKKVGYRGK